MQEIQDYVSKVNSELKEEVFISQQYFKKILGIISRMESALQEDRVIQDKDNQLAKDSLLRDIELIRKQYIQPIARKFAQDNGHIADIGHFLSSLISPFVNSLRKQNPDSQESNIFFSEASNDIWACILSYLSFRERRHLAQVSKFFKSRVENYPLPREGFVRVRYKGIEQVVNLAVFHKQQKKSVCSEKDLADLCNKKAENNEQKHNVDQCIIS